MLNCKQVSRLVSESLEHPLPFRQRMGVRIHLMMCSLCRTYQRQVLTLRNIVRQSDTLPEKHLPPEAAQRIKTALKNKK